MRFSTQQQHKTFNSNDSNTTTSEKMQHKQNSTFGRWGTYIYKPRCMTGIKTGTWVLTMASCLPPHHTTSVLWPFFWDHPGEPVPEENLWTLCCKGRLTEADTLTIRLCATPAGLTSAHPHHPIFTGRISFLSPNQQCQSTEGNNG